MQINLITLRLVSQKLSLRLTMSTDKTSWLHLLGRHSEANHATLSIWT